MAILYRKCRSSPPKREQRGESTSAGGNGTRLARENVSNKSPSVAVGDTFRTRLNLGQLSSAGKRKSCPFISEAEVSGSDRWGPSFVFYVRVLPSAAWASGADMSGNEALIWYQMPRRLCQWGHWKGSAPRCVRVSKQRMECHNGDSVPVCCTQKINLIRKEGIKPVLPAERLARGVWRLREA